MKFNYYKSEIVKVTMVGEKYIIGQLIDFDNQYIYLTPYTSSKYPKAIRADNILVIELHEK